jgi:microsomal dipeptidase-like Zn-dependent dipeptidase
MTQILADAPPPRDRALAMHQRNASAEILDFRDRVGLASVSMLSCRCVRWALGPVFFLLLLACDDDPSGPAEPRGPGPEVGGIHAVAGGCFVIDATAPGGADPRWLEATGDDGYTFSAASEESGERFVLRATDLATYLLYSADRHYAVGESSGLARAETLTSELDLLDDSYVSPAEWQLEESASDSTRFQLHHLATGRYLTMTGLAEAEADAAVVTLSPATGCSEFPELTVDAEGEITRTSWDDGDVYGIVETHSHLFTNLGFGGGGIFHGAPFHRLGVEKALPSCAPFHGEEGRLDLVGYAFSGLENLDTGTLLGLFTDMMTPEFDHFPDGYPDFTDWPNTWKRATHQTQYYRWLERAYRGGLRLLVQHATTNSVLCELITGLGVQSVRYACNDMVNVDRILAETRALERYIDAQSGGPGEGWFRVVESPAEARAVIAGGKLAVVLGIETSNLFDCFLTPPPGVAACDVDKVKADLDRYRELGVRVLFPVHKFDNAFSAGDGDRNVGQLGSFVNSGHFSNFVQDCPDSPSVFDNGRVIFGGLNQPRKEYAGPAPNDLHGFAEDPLGALLPFLAQLQEPALEGDYCQNAGLTPLGETLLLEMMKRGMLIEVDHMPRRSFVRAYELLVENDYPAVGSHGNTNRGVIYQLGGVSKLELGRCAAADRTGAMGDSLRARVAEIVANGGYPGEGFGFDLNGFAGGPRPRFGADSLCGDVPQANPITYPFSSYAGDITFQEPQLGNRPVDFNTEGMIHLGLLPELIEDVRRDGVTDAELEPLFRSAEAYLRMWERAEARAAEISAGR